MDKKIVKLINQIRNNKTLLIPTEVIKKEHHLLINRIRNNRSLSISTKDIAICYIEWASKGNAKNIDYNSSSDLNFIFFWAQTPQGHMFWEDIKRALQHDWK